jgi:sulfur carrier protein ThiS
LHTTFRYKSKGKLIDQFSIRVAKGTKVEDVIDIINLPLGEDTYFIIRDHKILSRENLLSDGDKLSILPIISGGGYQ